MCPNGKGMIGIEKGYMPLALFKEIIDQIKDHTSTIVIALHGESLLHPHFIDMVCYAKRNGIKVSLNTNATLLTQNMSHQILSSGINFISFAFDGFNKVAYESTRKGSNFEKTIQNILYFLMLKKKSKSKLPYTILSILKIKLDEQTEKDKKQFVMLFKGLVDEVRLREVSSWGKTFKDTKEFTAYNSNGHFNPCSRLWSSICIAWNGDVIPCIYNANHEYVLGNIKDACLRDIWNNNRMQTLRRSMVQRNPLLVSPICENCIVTGTPPILSIPSGLRISLADAVVNFTGYWFERELLKLANLLHHGTFSSKQIN